MTIPFWQRDEMAFNAGVRQMLSLDFAIRPDRKRCAVVGQGRGGTTIVETRIAISDAETLVNGSHRFKLTSAMLDQMVANYALWRSEGGAPAPGYFGHATSEDHARNRAAGQEDPALYVLEIRREGDDLVARLEFMPWAWSRVWADGAMQWRGLSIVFAEEAKDRHGKPQGATFFGVDIVPDPFLPGAAIAAAKTWSAGAGERGEPIPVLHLSCRVALGSGPGDHGSASDPKIQNDGPGGETIMPEENVVKQLLAEKDSKIESLTRENTQLKDQLAKQKQEHEAALSAAKKDADEAKTALQKDRDARALAEKDQAGKDAQEAITLALKAGVLKKAEVEGYEKDGAAAVLALEKLGQTAKGLRLFCSRIKDGDGQGRVVTMGKTIDAGQPQTADDGDTNPVAWIDAETKKLAQEQKISYADALKLMRTRHPERFAAALARQGASQD